MRPVAARRGDRHAVGLYRDGHRSGAAWLFVRLRWWWGFEVRWDPEILGSKAMVTLADRDVGWLQ